nr:MAG TPA: hypothetical protein [Bacteriophage sp.]
MTSYGYIYLFQIPTIQALFPDLLSIVSYGGLHHFLVE